MADHLINTHDSERERLEDFKKDFKNDWESDRDWRLKRKEWLDFYHGRQWDQEELEVLRDRGQPATVRNRIKPKIDALIGTILGLKVDTKAFDVGLRDFDTAKHISEALRIIEDDNDFDTVEAQAFGDMVKTGRGWYESEIDWIDFEAFTKTERAYNSDVTPDRHGKRDDLSDYKRLHKHFWMDLDDAIEFWPDKEQELKDSLHAEQLADEPETKQPHRTIRGDQYDNPQNEADLFRDQDRNRLRIVRSFYRTQIIREFITHPELGTEEITNLSETEIQTQKELWAGAVTWKKAERQMNVITFTSLSILEEQKDVRSYDEEAKFPLTLLPGWYDEELGYHVGMIEQLMDLQKEVNKRGSKMLHLLNIQQVEMEEDAVENLQRLRQEIARPDGVIEHKRGFQFKINRNIDLSQNQFALMQEAKSEIDASGVAGELAGQSDASSGKEFQLRQEAAIRPIRELFLNARAARRRVGMLWLDDIQQYWTSERMIKATDDPEAGRIVLNQRVVDPMTGQVTILNDVSLGRYDIKIEEAPDTLNLRSEIFNGLVKLAQTGVQIPVEMIIEASDFPNKTRFLEQLRQQQQAQAQQLASGQVPALPPGRRRTAGQ